MAPESGEYSTGGGTPYEPAPIEEVDKPFSRWEDIKQRFLTDWRRDHFGRHTIYWSVAILGGGLCYGIALRLAEALGFGW